MESQAVRYRRRAEQAISKPEVGEGSQDWKGDDTTMSSTRPAMSVATAVLPNFGKRARHVLCGISSRDVYTGEYPRARSAARHGLGPHSAIASAYDIDALNVSGGRATCKAGE